jgi:hypothetical protein
MVVVGNNFLVYQNLHIFPLIMRIMKKILAIVTAFLTGGLAVVISNTAQLAHAASPMN